MEIVLKIVLLISVTTGVFCSTVSVEISPKKEFLLVHIGDTLELTCEQIYTDKLDKSVNFKKNTQVLTQSESRGYDLTQSGGFNGNTNYYTRHLRLVKEKVEISDQAKFTCFTENIESSIDVHVVKINNIDVTLPILGTADKVELRCELSPTLPKVLDEKLFKWTRNGVDITSDSKYEVYQNGSLIVKDVEPEDVGQYSCTVVLQPSSATDRQEFTNQLVALRGGPMLVEVNHVKNKDVIQGDKLELTCDVYGYPPPDVIWFKDGVQLKKTDLYTFHTYKNMTNGQLTVPTMDSDDEGNYSCTANNSVEPFSVTANMEVRVMLATPTSPKIVDHDDNKDVAHGEELKLTCDITGHPRPNITWFKDGAPLNNTDRISFQVYKNTNNGQLTILNLDYADRGTYSCVANNTVSPYSAAVYMKVVVRDKLAALWPFLGILLQVIVLCIIIFVYEKRRSNRFADDNDSADTNDDNSVDSKGVRRRT
mgnify:CR=1 FL=1